MNAVLVGCPTYNGSLDFGTARGLLMSASQKHEVIAVVNPGSLLSHACNAMWCMAMNEREMRGLGWFAMLHADIEPDVNWLDTLIDEAEECDADVMSAVVPIKDNVGITSTAIARPDDWGPWARITQKQLWHPDFPETFDIGMAANALNNLPDDLRTENAPANRLLVNTGCCVFRLGQSWNGKVAFEMRDRIDFIDGKYEPRVESEDWTFSRRAAEAGARVMATRKLKVLHKGGANYSSANQWGDNRDPAYEAMIKEQTQMVGTANAS